MASQFRAWPNPLDILNYVSMHSPIAQFSQAQQLWLLDFRKMAPVSGAAHPLQGDCDSSTGPGNGSPVAQTTLSPKRFKPEHSHEDALTTAHSVGHRHSPLHHQTLFPMHIMHFISWLVPGKWGSGSWNRDQIRSQGFNPSHMHSPLGCWFLLSHFLCFCLESGNSFKERRLLLAQTNHDPVVTAFSQYMNIWPRCPGNPIPTSWANALTKM